MTQNQAYAMAEQALAQGQHALARAVLQPFLAIKKDCLFAHQQLTLSYIHTGHYAQAQTHAHIWSLLEPQNPQAHWLNAQLLRQNGRAEELILRSYLKVERYSGLWPGLNVSLAKVYFGRRQLDLARHYFERALLVAQDNVVEINQIKWEYAMMLLTLGEYKLGWAYHETRLLNFDSQGLNLAPLPCQAWQGESLKNKSIVVHGEQGIGDEIMYASMIHDLLAAKAKVTFACYPALVDVMQKSFPQVNVVPHPRGLKELQQWQQGIMPQWWSELKNVDYQIPMGSLAHQLRPNKASFPRQPYLVVDAQLADKHQELVQQQAALQNIDLTGKTLIALAWCGNLANPHGRAKSIELSELAPLKDVIQHKNIVFISLQNRQYGKQALEQAELPIIDMSEFTDGFADTLALAGLCHQIVTIDTSYFHICAAAGLNVTLLLRRNCDWRFGWTSQDCDWYPNVSVIRQEEDLNWQSVVETLKNKLDQQT